MQLDLAIQETNCRNKQGGYCFIARTVAEKIMGGSKQDVDRGGKNQEQSWG